MTPYYHDNHVTIYHGDCRDIIQNLKSGVMVTDPPYGICLKSGMGGRHGECHVESDCNTAVRDEILLSWQPKPAIVFGSWKRPRPESTVDLLIWDKGEHVGMGNLLRPWKPNHEEIYVIGQGFHGRRRGSVLRHLAVAGCVGLITSRWHPTEKPVSLMKELILCCPAGTIIDPFMGSGTTLRAAKDLGRKAIGIEIEEKYCEIAAKRMAQEVLDLTLNG